MTNLRYLCGELESAHAVASNALRQLAVDDAVEPSIRWRRNSIIFVA